MSYTDVFDLQLRLAQAGIRMLGFKTEQRTEAGKDQPVTKLAGVSIGDKGSHSRTIRTPDILKFAELSGDKNPLHFDDERAKRSILKGVVVHGMLAESLISAAIGNTWQGAILAHKEEVFYHKPVRPGDRVDAVVEVVELIPGKYPKAKLECWCSVGETIVISTRVTIVLP